MKTPFVSFSLLLCLFLVACGAEPEPASTATATSTSTVATTTAVSEPTSTPEPEPPTAEPEESTAVPTTEPSPTATATAVSNDPATFNLPASVAATAILTTVQSTASQPANLAPYWGIMPTHHIYQLADYGLSGTFHNPRLIIYSVPEFADINPAAREAYTQLQAILADRPNLAAQETLPFLPIFNAAQVFHAQEAYLTFANGQGIRYITQFDQAFNPINNRTVFYTFQGLTSDGRHYVTAVLPIAHPSLPADGQLSPENFETFAANFDDYLQEIISTLDEADPDSFSPSLTDLDSLLASVQVNLPAPTKRTNDSGQIVLTLARPAPHAQLEIGSEITVSGYVAPGTTEAIELALTSGVNLLTSTMIIPDSTTGNWTASLLVPATVQGRGVLTARSSGQQDSVPVYMYAPFEPQGNDPTAVVVSLLRPMLGSSLTIGMPGFFEGRVQNPLDNNLTIALLGNNCTTFYARQNIALPAGGGQWNGVLFLPAEQMTPDETACAIAYTGTYGEDWREVQLAMPLARGE